LEGGKKRDAGPSPEKRHCGLKPPGGREYQTQKKTKKKQQEGARKEGKKKGITGAERRKPRMKTPRGGKVLRKVSKLPKLPQKKNHRHWEHGGKMGGSEHVARQGAITGGEEKKGTGEKWVAQKKRGVKQWAHKYRHNPRGGKKTWALGEKPGKA